MNLIVRREQMITANQMGIQTRSSIPFYSFWHILSMVLPIGLDSECDEFGAMKSLHYFLISLIGYLTFLTTAALQLSFTVAPKPPKAKKAHSRGAWQPLIKCEQLLL